MFQWHGWPATSPFLTLAQKLYALDHEPALVLRERDPATGGYISRPPMIPAICVIGWPRITDVHARQRSPAIGRRLHKKSIFCTKSSPLMGLYVQSRPEWRPPPSHHAASTPPSTSRFVVSAKIPLQDLLGQCQRTDWIGLW